MYLFPGLIYTKAAAAHWLWQIYTSASLTGFIDTYQLASEVEQVDQLRQQIEDNDSTLSPNHLALRVSFILACASLAAVNLDATKAQELGLVRISIDAFARELWTNARSLIIYFDSDPFMMGFEITKSALSTAPPSQVDSSSFQLLRLVAIKLLLLLAARSFAVPSEYLKIHLDTISSAIKALFGPSWDDNVPLEERELRWQLSSFLCVLDWTSPGIYHNGNYFLRPAMQIDPPSKVPGVSDDGTNTPTLIDARLLERLGQTRYFLEYALALSNLSRRAEDCILRPGLISPAKAAELCSELDALDNKLSFYQLLGWARGREGSGPGSSVSVSGGGGEGSDGGDKHRVSFQRAPQVQNAYLNLELGLIRFKLFRHETFHLMQGATTPGALQIMCIDACVDACIIVLSQCRSIAMEGPHMANLAAQGMQNTALTDCASTGANGEKEKRPLLGSLRRVIQPASSAALVGQTLLHISQSADGLGLLPPDNHSNPSRPTPLSDLSSYAESSMESSFQYHFANNNGNASWNSRFGREKVSILEWHVCNVMTALEALQSTSPLARYRLDLHQQCM